jgi:hypothetical protein
MTGTNQIANGQCFCGAVKYAAKPPAKWVAHCHCSMCRRSNMAAFVTWVGFPKGAVRITAGAHRLKAYESSPGGRREFCVMCGAQLFAHMPRWEDEVHVTRASFVGDVDLPPTTHAFFSDRVDWARVDDHLPKRGGPSGTDPLPQ